MWSGDGEAAELMQNSKPDKKIYLSQNGKGINPYIISRMSIKARGWESELCLLSQLTS